MLTGAPHAGVVTGGMPAMPAAMAGMTGPIAGPMPGALPIPALPSMSGLMDSNGMNSGIGLNGIPSLGLVQPTDGDKGDVPRCVAPNQMA